MDVVTHLANQGLLYGLRVLVVDDGPDERMLLANYLQGLGCRTYVGTDGQDGYRKARMVQPDLILLDVRMPVCDGLTACRMLKEDASTAHIPVVFITGAVEPEDRVQGLLAGAVDYVTKPFNFEEIRLRLSIRIKQQAPTDAPAPPEEAPEHGGSRLDKVLFQSACLQLFKSLDQTPELDALAAKVGTNARRLNEAFKRCVGVTVFDYLRERRMKEAQQLLADTALEIQAIALELGFSSGANFSTAFRERFGVSPRGFRQSRQGPTA